MFGRRRRAQALASALYAGPFGADSSRPRRPRLSSRGFVGGLCSSSSSARLFIRFRAPFLPRARHGVSLLRSPTPTSSVLRKIAARGPCRIARLAYRLPSRDLRRQALRYAVPPFRQIVLPAPTCLSTGASANAPFLRMRDANTRPRNSLRGSRWPPWRARSDSRTACGRWPSLSMSGLSSRGSGRGCFWSWLSPRIDRYSHWTDDYLVWPP